MHTNCNYNTYYIIKFILWSLLSVFLWVEIPVLVQLLKFSTSLTCVSKNHSSATALKFAVADRFNWWNRYYCSYFLKVACTNWKRVMLLLTGKLNVSNISELAHFPVHYQLQSKYLVPLSRYNSTEIRRRLQNYFKFLFVRHPFERIVSAYEDKLVAPRGIDIGFQRGFGMWFDDKFNYSSLLRPKNGDTTSTCLIWGCR